MSRLWIRTARVKSRFYIRLLQVLGLLGAGFLTSCVKNTDDPVPMYGVIPGDGSIRFHGTIQSEDSLRNIPGLKVRLVRVGGGDSVQTSTDLHGQFSLYQYSFAGEVFKLKILDTDSAANVGWFTDKTVEIEVDSRDVNNEERQVDALLRKK